MFLSRRGSGGGKQRGYLKFLDNYTIMIIEEGEIEVVEIIEKL
jgi:hypothetical protein